MPTYPWIEFPLCVLAVVGPGVVITFRLCAKKRIEKPDGTIEVRPCGIGVRMIQLIAVLALVPIIAILGLEKILSGRRNGEVDGCPCGLCSRGDHKCGSEGLRTRWNQSLAR
jgi:hypothetical protein